MNFGIFVKYSLFFVLQRNIYRQLETVSPCHCVVITYHRVLPKDEVMDGVEPGMYVTPSTLQSHIRFLKNYFDIVSIGRAENFLKKKGNVKKRKPCCVISFDDGWRDFYVHAFPVLHAENVPAVVYLPTNLIGTERIFWTDRLAWVFEQTGVKLIAELLGKKIERGAFGGIFTSRRQLVDKAIGLLKEYPHQEIEDILDLCENEVGVSQGSRGRTFMNWDEVRELFGTGLISFGSHTVNHAILTTLQVDDVKLELALSRQKLLREKVVGNSIPFCYPNGNYTSNISNLVSESGFSSAVTCDPGSNIVGNDLFTLKRISVHQDISSSESLLAYRLAQYL